MFTRFILFVLLIAATTCVSATERFSLSFELNQSEKMIEQGRAVVSGKQRTWSKGLQRSYLKLRCNQLESGKTEKLFSTVNHFAGLRITHQIAGDKVELSVVRNVVAPRLAEIRALARNECKDLSPIVTTTKTYSFPAEDGINESSPFGESLVFRATIQSVGE